MKSKGNGKLVIANSLIWAAAFVASASILQGTGHFEEMFLILFILWTMSHLALTQNAETVDKEWSCIRRWFSGKEEKWM